MKPEKIFFISGATGLVGGSLTVTALRAGHCVRLLVRNQQDRSPEERIRQVLNCLGFSSGEWIRLAPKIEIDEGDITVPRFGLSHRQWQRLADGLSGIYHSAAYIGFRKDQKARSVLSNIDGTRHVLELAERSRAHLFHISTAYVAGEQKGRVAEEEVQALSPWRNPYEETKALAEQEVHATCRKKNLKYTVFRPAILIGDSVSGRTIRFNSIYSFMKLFHRLSKQTEPSPALLEAKPEATLNLVPVDVAIRAIWALSEHPGCEGKIFHITNPSPPRFKDLAALAEIIFDLSIACSVRLPLPPRGKNGEARETLLSLYAPYMRGEPEFDLKNTVSLLPDYRSGFPPLAEAYFRKILTYAIEQDWKDPTALPAKRSAGKPRLEFPEKYFNEFLGGKINHPLLRNVRNLNAVFSIEIDGETNCRWVLEVREGTLLSVSRNGAAAECGYVTDGATFERIVRGLYPPEEAFFEGRIDIRGNMEKGLRVAAVLSSFCTTYPYEEKRDPE